MIKKTLKSKKLLLFFSVIILLIVSSIFIFNNNLKLNIHSEYSYNEFVKEKFKVLSKKAIWNINNYDFYKGKSPLFIPIKIGHNVLTITKGDKKVIYEFNIDKDDALFLDYDMDYDEMSFSGDGLSNKVKKELGLATYTDDTDGDGLKDNVELLLGTDPKKKDNYNEKRTYTIFAEYIQDEQSLINDKVALKINGIGNITNTFLDVIDNIDFSGLNFVKSDIVKISTSESDVKRAKFTLSFDIGNQPNYKIYEYINGNLDEMESEFKENKISTNKAKIGSLYFVGDKTKEEKLEKISQVGILIDNSGSMYSLEYVCSKLNNDKEQIQSCIETIDTSKYMNDVNFKRVDLMNSLVEKLAEKNKELLYKIGAFTADYYDITDWSNDISKTKEGIESIKTKYQNFNGTAIGSSILNMAADFDTSSYGSKNIILLTDGLESTGLLNYSFPIYDYELKRIKAKGIHITTICLGECDSEYLLNISTKTNGKFLRVSDSDALQQLLDLILSMIDNTIEVKDLKEDEKLVVDSGFRPSIDGLPFDNYDTYDSPGGQCFGISFFVKNVYDGVFPRTTSQYQEDKEGYMPGYSLTPKNIEMIKKGQLYKNLGYVNKQYDFILNHPNDYYSKIEDNKVYINEKYLSNLGEKGIKLVEEKTKDDKLVECSSSLVEKYGISGSYNKFDTLNILINTQKVSDTYKDAHQIFNIINRNFYIQQYGKTFNFIQDFLYRVNNKSGDEKGFSENQFNSVVSELESGSPVLLTIYGSLLHEIVGTKLVQVGDTEKFRLYVYDSNYHGDDNRYSELTRIRVKQPLSKEYTKYDFKYENYLGIRYTSKNMFKITY